MLIKCVNILKDSYKKIIVCHIMDPNLCRYAV